MKKNQQKNVNKCKHANVFRQQNNAAVSAATHKGVANITHTGVKHTNACLLLLPLPLHASFFLTARLSHDQSQAGSECLNLQYFHPGFQENQREVNLSAAGGLFCPESSL